MNKKSIFFVVFASFWVFFPILPALSQLAGPIDWSHEEVITTIEGVKPQTFFPVVAADSYGAVHLFWTEGRVIYYAQKDLLGWSNPIDVVWFEPGGLQFPSVAIDQNGIIHLVWVIYSQIRYKSVPAWETTDLHRWSEERTIGVIGGVQTPVRIGVDHQNRLHVIFVDAFGSSDTFAGNVYHFMSSDSGESWSDFEQVSSVPSADLATDPRMAFDDHDRTHIVWGEMSPNADGAQRGVFYTQLDEMGQALSPIIEIDHLKPKEKWMMAINVGITGDNDVQAIWTCGERPERCHAWSSDGGQTWTAPKKIFEGLIGLSGWDAFFNDGSGMLYYLSVLRYPQAMHYSYWNRSQWESPPLIASTDPYMQVGENVMAAVGMGNRVHVVAQLGDTIFYMDGMTGAAEERQTPPATPTAVYSPAASPEIVIPLASPLPQSAPATPMQTFKKETVNQISGTQVYLISAISVGAFLALIIIIRVIKTRF
jgi:hypothetical protein